MHKECKDIDAVGCKKLLKLGLCLIHNGKCNKTCGGCGTVFIVHFLSEIRNNIYINFPEVFYVISKSLNLGQNACYDKAGMCRDIDVKDDCSAKYVRERCPKKCGVCSGTEL